MRYRKMDLFLYKFMNSIIKDIKYQGLIFYESYKPSLWIDTEVNKCDNDIEIDGGLWVDTSVCKIDTIIKFINPRVKKAKRKGVKKKKIKKKVKRNLSIDIEEIDTGQITYLEGEWLLIEF